MTSPEPPPDPADDPTRSVPPGAHLTPSLPDAGAGADTAPPTPAAADTGRFRPLSVHRVGGMGRLHVALDAELNRHVVLKEIRPDLAHNPDTVRHFLFEAEVTGRLEHPGVVPVYGLGQFPDGRPYYAMRFIDGQSLRDAIRAFHGTADEDGPNLPPAGPDRAAALRRLLSRFVALCQSVAYAHSRGVIHRDLKPHNVMLGPFGETILVDWGLAKRMRDDDRGSNRVGTPGYWAPEQARGDVARHDERTDVYGLGAILFEILTGRPPHPHGDHGPGPPSAAGGPVPIDDELDEIVRTALSIDPEDRQPSAEDLARQVDGWLGEQPVAGQRAVVRVLTEELARDPGRRDLGDHLARQQANLGLMYFALDKPMRAAVAFSYAVRWYEDLEAAGTAAPRDRAELANIRLHLAECFAVLGLPDRAAEEREAARRTYAGLIAAHPGEFRANIATLIVTHGGQLPAPPPLATPAPADRTHHGPPPAAASTPPPAAEESVPPSVRAASARGPAELIQGYTVVRPLGRGGLGQVLLARDHVLNRLVAIKDFLPDLPPAARVRVVREMQVTARLIHPHIVRAYTYGLHPDGSRPFMVMEYIPGHSLQTEIAEFHADPHRKLSPADPAFARLVSAVAQACDGVHFAHTQGVLHRDPKPANVMVHEDGRAVVIDWGLAKVTGATADADDGAAGALAPYAGEAAATHDGLLGTPAYMAPEQIRGVTPGPATDIYTLGVGLFEVLTGGHPYVAPTLNELLQKVLFGKPDRPRDLVPEVPVELEAVCAAAMAYRPEERYVTAAALADDLRAWLAGRPVSVRHRGRLRRLWEQLTGRG